MAWSKVTSKYPKPIGWWYRKIMCEIGWHLGSRKMYYHHLREMCRIYELNLYGEPI